MSILVKPKRTSQKEMLLKELKKAGKEGLTNIKLSKINIRYGGLLGELYKEGYKIDTISLGDGVYVYKYVSSPKTKVIRETAIDKLKKEIKGKKVTEDNIEEILSSINASVRYNPNTYK